MHKQKIVITGSMGYIATSLLELYSGEARYKDIICIDSRFCSERVKQLTDWGMTFRQGSILDRAFLQQYLKDADIVYHLAGITDVAYTATESNRKQDELISTVGTGGTQNILSSISKSCRMVFPSTHVVYEGFTETVLDISEEYPISPVLTYARSKGVSESHISKGDIAHDISAHDNHIIVRLGSVYGYSGDTMRINIMPNKFASIAAQDGTISMYGGGQQYKSLVHVVDVARAMKFLAESEHTGTYHLSNENMTVRDVAEICKEVNPKVTLLSTDNEIPNKGYTLSNQKLLDTGFKFRYNIRDAIADMIHKWGSKEQPTDLEYIQKGGKEYKDQRGIIRNYELTEPINLIGWIESKAGTVRANHYHPIQEQKCLLLKGRYVSVIQDLSIPDAPLEYRTITPGDVAVIRPNVAHAMVFLEDSLFLNLVRGEREHENYGITHTIPYELVTEQMRQDIMVTYSYVPKTECRVCGSRKLDQVLSLGDSPLANNLLNSPTEQCPTYPLELMKCRDCHNVQLSVVVTPTKLFDNYLYVSSTSPVFREHFAKAAEQYIHQFDLTESSVVWDIGSNDGIALKPLQERGIKVCGIEPAKNVAEIANNSGIPTIQGYFNQDTANEAYHKSGSPDIVTASNVFAHADDLQGIAKTVFGNLKPNGIFIVEVQYLMDTINDLTFDNIYHEHVNYWSVTALNTFCNRLGYHLFHVEHIDTHGGSIRVYICSDDRLISSSVDHYLKVESEKGIHDMGTFEQFRDRVYAIRDNVRKNLQTMKHLFKPVGYGSPAKATTALNYFGITSDDIKFTLEDNLLKQGKFIPGTGIQIIQTGTAFDIVIVFAWNFYKSIREKIDPAIPCISIKDLELDNTAFTKLLGEKYTTNDDIYTIDYDDFAFKISAGVYWREYYHMKPLEPLQDCYRSMLKLIKTLPKDKVIIDIGANVGLLAIPATMIGYKVHAFDPAEQNMESLYKGIELNNLTNLQVYQYALSDHTGDALVYVPECPDNSAMDKGVAVAKMISQECAAQRVQAITFDDWLTPDVGAIGLIKIDTQGHELQVIQGMSKFLSGCRDVYILCEFDDSLGDQSIGTLDILIGAGFTELPSITNEDKLFYKA